MTARQKFPKGCRVRLSPLGLDRVPHVKASADRKGTVLGWSNDWQCVRLRWDGRATPERYHGDFLERVWEAQ
jgi:hypothetical protein